MDRPNFYAGLTLDRAVARRRDAAWLAQRLRHPESRLIPVWRSRNLVRPGEAPSLASVSMAEFATIGINGGTGPILLGEERGTAWFACDLSPLDEAALERAFAWPGEFIDLRSVGPLIDRQQGSLLAYARGLAHWHARHGHCGVCGSPTRSDAAGHLRVCINPGCAAQHFPRTDPAVIMLVTHGDHCLLGRQPEWPPGMHSTLAGFVEPGESLEEAVAREVREEAGIEVSDVRYHSSQPWPFPASIMLGFVATAAATAIAIDPVELEEARWYSRDFLLRERDHDPDRFRLPRIDSIARRLVEDWLHGLAG